VYRKAEGSVCPLVARLGALRRSSLIRSNRQADLFAHRSCPEEFGDFDSYCWRFVGAKSEAESLETTGQIPATSPESEAFSKDLKPRAFSFVGPTVLYAYMQAVGMVNDHLLECFRYREIMREVANAN
jgi:DNA-3-methyladenine glycosylase I